MENRIGVSNVKKLFYTTSGFRENGICDNLKRVQKELELVGLISLLSTLGYLYNYIQNSITYFGNDKIDLLNFEQISKSSYIVRRNSLANSVIFVELKSVETSHAKEGYISEKILEYLITVNDDDDEPYSFIIRFMKNGYYEVVDLEE